MHQGVIVLRMNSSTQQQGSVKIFVIAAALIVGIFIAGGYSMRDSISVIWGTDELTPNTLSKKVDHGDVLDPLAGEERMIAIVAQANKAVVSIVVTKDVPVLERYYEEYNPFGEGWGSFRIPRVRERGTQEREIGGGSGFIVSPDGYVVTNRHVVDDTEAEYTVFSNLGQKYEATVIARDPMLDIAVLKISDPATQFSYLSFADSDTLRLGQTAIAIGNALAEFRNSVSVGIVSGLSRSIIAGDGRGSSEELSDVIQTDAAINPGNSGGPLLDSSGRVIGVNVAVALGSENIGFALPANAVRAVVESVQEHGKIVRPYLGVRYQMITPEIADALELSNEFGALVDQENGVVAGSPAQQAGLKNGDLITYARNQFLSENSLGSVIQQAKVGERIKLLVMRGRVEVELWVVLEEMPKNL
jgi:S1-C subfamily serine protease